MSKVYKHPNIYPLTEMAVNVVFGNKIDETIHQRVKKLMDALDDEPFTGYVECVPSYVGLTVFYDPMKIKAKHSPSAHVMDMLHEKACSIEEKSNVSERGNVVTIPVCYDFGPDLAHVAEVNGRTTEDVIRIHTERDYLVYMIGFAPGFPYLGGMSETIATPRKDKPRMKLPAGAVGVAGAQTGVYPIESPGGWQWIGQTPLTLFDETREQPSLLRAGDIVRFKAISRDEFSAYGEGRS